MKGKKYNDKFPLWLHLIGFLAIIIFNMILSLLGIIRIPSIFGDNLMVAASLYGGYQGYVLGKTKEKNPYLFYFIFEIGILILFTIFSLFF